MAITGTIIARAVLLLYIVGGMEARSGVGHTMPPDVVLGRHVCTSDKVREAARRCRLVSLSAHSLFMCMHWLCNIILA